MERNRDIACLDWCSDDTSFDEVTRIPCSGTCNAHAAFAPSAIYTVYIGHIDAHNYERDVGVRAHSGHSRRVRVAMYSGNVPARSLRLLSKITLCVRKKRGNAVNFRHILCGMNADERNIVPWLIASSFSEIRVVHISEIYMHTRYAYIDVSIPIDCVSLLFEAMSDISQVVGA